MRKYRTKSGKVEEKLPGVNATVNPSEKAQIAMAGGADTLKDVQVILGQEGKRNNLKGQGAKHLVSFAYGDPDDDETGAAATFGGQEVGASFGVGGTEGVFGASADPSVVADLGYGPESIEGYDDYKTDPRGTKEGARDAAKDALLNKGTYTARTTEPKSTVAIAKEALLDMNKSESEREYNDLLGLTVPGRSVLTYKQNVKDRVAESWKEANTLRTRTEVLEDRRGLPGGGPLTLEQEDEAVKALGWAKREVNKVSFPGVEKSVTFNKEGRGEYGVTTDYTDLLVGGLANVASAGTAGAVKGLIETLNTGYQLTRAWENYKTKGAPATDQNRRQDYLTDRPDYPEPPSKPTPPPTGDSIIRQAKVNRAAANNVTLNILEEDKLPTRTQRRSRGG